MHQTIPKMQGFVRYKPDQLFFDNPIQTSQKIQV